MQFGRASLSALNGKRVKGEVSGIAGDSKSQLGCRPEDLGGLTRSCEDLKNAKTDLDQSRVISSNLDQSRPENSKTRLCPTMKAAGARRSHSDLLRPAPTCSDQKNVKN